MILNKEDKKPIKIGLWAGLIASLCCIGPLILIIFGVGGTGAALSIGKQSPYFLGSGILILIGGLWLYYFRRKKKLCDECGAERLGWKKAVLIVILACLSFITIYYFLLYILMPWLAPIIYKNFYRAKI
ncbi:MAG TPA: LPXTG cell wall anchor domain-containing protein [Candidatus Campbellbacteria bacterium]|nr:LPXTG cell wall anchor domain-containing protein [Candidatus Campbellbacteria bacterium]